MTFFLGGGGVGVGDGNGYFCGYFRGYFPNGDFLWIIFKINFLLCPVVEITVTHTTIVIKKMSEVHDKNTV